MKKSTSHFVLVFVALVWIAFYLHHTKEKQLALQPDAQGEALIGGDFTLVDQHGKTVTNNDFKGKMELVFFGFTNCPDVCPATLARVDQIMKKLGDDAKNITPIFITVDPERDTPEVMANYLKNFESPYVGLTGTEAQIKQAEQAFRVYASKEDQTKEEEEEAEVNEHSEHDHGDGDAHEHGEAHEHGGDHEHGYQVNHSALLYLMDKDGKYLSIFHEDEPFEGVVNTIKSYMAAAK